MFSVLLSIGLFMSLILSVAEGFLQVIKKMGQGNENSLQKCNILLSIFSLVSLQ